MRRARYYLGATALALLAAAAAVYIPGLHGPFVFDDLTNILQVPDIRITDLSFDSLRQAWYAREDALIGGRPIAMLSFGLNYYFTQLDVFYFKLTNLGIHLATGGALYCLTLLLLRRHQLASPSCPYQTRHLPWLALAISAVWLLHPLNLTSVLYIVQRMTSLTALFTVLGLIGYCYGREQVIQGEKAGLATIPVSLALFGGLATLCKENGVLLLPLAVLVEVAFYRFAAHATLATLFRRFWLIVILLPLVLALAGMLLQHERWFGEHGYRTRDFTLEERLLTQSRAVWFYLRLILLPDIAKMGLFHDAFPLSRSLTEPISTLWAVIGVAGLIAAAVMARARLPVLFFAIGWFFIGHSMESTAFPLEMIHEHRNYLPQYGVLFAVVYFAGAPYSSRRLDRTLRLRLGFLVLYAVLLGSGTLARSLQWKDDYSLYAREVINHPTSPRAQSMLGALKHHLGFHDQARTHLTIASNLTLNRPEHLISLVHHVYIANHKVPAEIMEELRYRLMHGLVTDVTLWAYEPLLVIARGDARWHDRFIDLYAMTISRTDVTFMRKRYETVYRLLADNHAYRGRAHVALRYYERARAIDPHPYYDIATAKVYADNTCYDKAEALVSNLRARHPKLASAHEELLRDVDVLLAGRKGRVSRCTL